MGTFETFADVNGRYHFRLTNENGSTLLSSESYTTKSARDNGICSVMANAGRDSQYERKLDNAGTFFILKAGNGYVLGKSPVFEHALQRESDIARVKALAPHAVVVAVEVDHVMR